MESVIISESLYHSLMPVIAERYRIHMQINILWQKCAVNRLHRIIF